MSAFRSSPLSNLLSDAAAAISRGNAGKALAHYRAAARLDPKNPMHTLRTGDCLVRLGRKEEARLTYRHVAERYAADGQYARAISVCRLVQRLAPDDAVVAQRLAELVALRARRERPAYAEPPPAAITAFLPVIELGDAAASEPEPPRAPRQLCSLWDEPAAASAPETAPAVGSAGLEATVRSLLSELRWIRRDLEVLKARTFVSEAVLTVG